MRDPAPDAERLQAIARRLEARPCNRPGTDKRWVLDSPSRALAFRREQRVPAPVRRALLGPRPGALI